MTFQALNSRILVEVENKGEQTTAGGIIIPEQDKRLPVEATVVSVGPYANGSRAEGKSEIRAGDTILVHLGAINTLDAEKGVHYVEAEEVLAKLA